MTWVAFLAAVLLATTSNGCKRGSKKNKLTRSEGAASVVESNVRTNTGAGPLWEEQEPNNSLEDFESGGAGNDVPFQVSGKLSPKDVDYFEANIETEGPVSISVTQNAKVDVVLGVIVGGEMVAVSDRGGVGVSEGVPNWFAPEGKLVVVVKRYDRKGKDKADAMGDYPYTLSVRALGGDYEERAEKEPNETLEDSDVLSFSDRRFGFLGWNGDVDTWRLPVGAGTGDQGKELVDIFFDGVPGVSPSLLLRRTNDETPVVIRKGGKGVSLSIQGFVPENGVDEYTVAVEGKRSNFEKQYVVWAVKRSRKPGEETEPNDYREQATLLSKTTSSFGTQRGAFGWGDVDYFSFPSPGSYRLSLTPAGNGIAILKVQTEGYEKTVKGKRGQVAVIENVQVVSAGAGDISVSGKVYGAASVDYELGWELVSE